MSRRHSTHRTGGVGGAEAPGRSTRTQLLHQQHDEEEERRRRHQTQRRSGCSSRSSSAATASRDASTHAASSTTRSRTAAAAAEAAAVPLTRPQHVHRAAQDPRGLIPPRPSLRGGFQAPAPPSSVASPSPQLVLERDVEPPSQAAGRPALQYHYRYHQSDYGDSYDRHNSTVPSRSADPCSSSATASSAATNPSSKPSPKGFVNVGNSCYANAALQCLLSTALSTALLNPKSAALFRRYSSNPNILAQGSGSVDSNEEKNVVKERRRKEDRRLQENCRWLTRELRTITAEHQTAPGSSSGPSTSTAASAAVAAYYWFAKPPVVDPGKITRHPDRLSPCLRPYQQEDAHEFLRALLSTLVMNGQNRRLSSLFDGLLESAVTCLSCHRPSLTRDRYMDLSLDICGTHVHSLDDALEEFTKTETLSGDNKVFCQKCGTKRTATKGLRLATAPSILVCHLKRFAFDAYGRLVRLDKRIQIPLLLEIASYMSSLNKARPPPYELVAVLVHQGQTCDSGHYLAYVKSNHQWYKCNDSVVEPVSVRTVLDQQAYMVLYEVEEMRTLHRSSAAVHSAPSSSSAPGSGSNFLSGWRDFLQSSCGVDDSLLRDICWHRPPPGNGSSSSTKLPQRRPRVRDRSIESHCSHDDLSTLGESCATVESSQYYPPEPWRRTNSSGNLKQQQRWHQHRHNQHLAASAAALPPRPLVGLQPPAPVPPHTTINNHNPRNTSSSSYWDHRNGTDIVVDRASWATTTASSSEREDPHPHHRPPVVQDP